MGADRQWRTDNRDFTLVPVAKFQLCRGRPSKTSRHKVQSTHVRVKALRMTRRACSFGCNCKTTGGRQVSHAESRSA